MKKYLLFIAISIFTFTSVHSATFPGNALNFDGVDDYVQTSDNDAGLTSYTISAWIYWTPSSNTNVEFVCSKGFEQMEIHTGGLSGANGLRFIPTDRVWLDATNVLPVGVWTYVVVEYDPSVSLAKMFINGAEVPLVNNGSNPVGTSIYNTSSVFSIGRRESWSTFYYNGSIDELRVWRNRILTPQEILSNMNNAVPSSLNSGLMSNYDFNVGIQNANNSGLTLLPDLQNNFNGTLYNFALNGTTSNWTGSFTPVNPVPVSKYIILSVFMIIGLSVFFKFRNRI
jgi:hypothetical protein